MFRRIRRPDDLHNDPHFVYQVGRLIGATEMLSSYMQIHGDDQAKLMGSRADESLNWFYEGERTPIPTAPLAASHEAVTEIRKPPSQ